MRSPFHTIHDAVTRWLNRGCENASPENALIMRRARGFALVAYFIQFFVGVVLSTALGRLHLALVSIMAMIATGACIRWLGRNDQHAKLAFHTAIGFCLAAISLGSLWADGAPPMSALYPIPLIMAANFVLGVWAAAGWTLATIAALGLVISSAAPPPHIDLDPQIWRAVVFSSRALVISVVFVLGAVGRRFEDRQTEQLAFLAHHDSLTGLANRAEFDYRLGLAIARSRRHQWSLALLFIDLDALKTINDTLGHVAGDAVLRAVSGQIRAATRKTDVAGRTGGDEFVVLLEAADEQKSALYGERLLERIEGCAVRTHTQLRVGASIGIAHFPRDAGDGEELMRRADAAMYEAKRAGGGRVVVATPPEAAGSSR